MMYKVVAQTGQRRFAKQIRFPVPPCKGTSIFLCFGANSYEFVVNNLVCHECQPEMALIEIDVHDNCLQDMFIDDLSWDEVSST
ncbi:hypothetical protein CL630_01570 [bacterium]|nr:hypothetical protein [bacterium]